MEGDAAQHRGMLIDAALNPAEIDLLPKRDLSDTTCVVFDILRATSAMVTGLAHGVTEIWPASTIDEAKDLKKKLPDAVLGGERHGDPIEGFDIGNNPIEYLNLQGRRVITTTTNGTVALRACAHGDRVLVGALLNMDGLRAEITRRPSKQLLLICAGTFETFALEDAIAAGLLAALFPNAELTDAAQAIRATAAQYKSPLKALLAARNGRALVDRGWGDQVEWCGQLSRFGTVGAMSGGVIRPL
jgi:2-phosphosulfolactate phosphatase